MTYIAEATFSVSRCPNPLIYNALFPDLGAHDLPRPLAGAPEVSTSPTTPELEPLKRSFDRDCHDRGFRRSVFSGPHHYILPLNAGEVENDPVLFLVVDDAPRIPYVRVTAFQLPMIGCFTQHF